MDTYNFTATCLFGLERFVGEEIDVLGYKRTETYDGRVHFTGDINAIARAKERMAAVEELAIDAFVFTAPFYFAYNCR